MDGEIHKKYNIDVRKKGLAKFQLERADFACGYFDGSGVHWTLKDAIGSIELVVSGDGRVEQHTGYYPYGQPWRAVAGQQRLFGDKELRTFAGLNDYDFHARFQNPAGPFFQSADRHAANDPARSPYTFAAANPVRFTDPSGLDATDTAAADSTGTALPNPPPPPKTNEKPEPLDLLQISLDGLNFAVGAQNNIITVVSMFDVRTWNAKEAVNIIYGSGLVKYLKACRYIGYAGIAITAINSYLQSKAYHEAGGDNIWVYVKLTGDVLMSAAADSHPVAFYISVGYTIADYKTEGFTTEKIILDQITNKCHNEKNSK